MKTFNCRRARPCLSAYLDGELTPERARTLEAHLRACADCAAHLDVLAAHAALVDAAADGGAAVPDGLWARARERAATRRTRASVGWRETAAIAAATTALVLLMWLAEPGDRRDVTPVVRPPGAEEMEILDLVARLDLDEAADGSERFGFRRTP